jgi:hypothetical protein
MTVRTAKGNGDWDVAGNWEPSGVPLTGDDVVVPKSLGVPLITNMDQTGVDLASFYSHPEYNFAIGASGDPLKIACTLMDVQHNGNFFFQCAANTASAFTTDEIRIGMANRSHEVEIGGAPGDKGDILLITALRGQIILTASAMFSASALVEVQWMENIQGDVKLTIDEEADDLATLETAGGETIARNTIATIRAFEGTLLKEKKKATTVDIYRAAVKYAHAAIAADATIIKIKGTGSLDLLSDGSIPASGTEPKTVSKTIRYPGSRLRTNDTMVTITTPIDLRQDR